MAVEKILALDLGTTSVGYAVINYDRRKHEGEITRLGVRVFPETLDAKERIPLNQQRRAKRMMRRQRRRRKLRMRTLNEYLHETGFLPKYGTPEWDVVMARDPYELRKLGLTSQLDRHDFGRAIYHLAQRRHLLGGDRDLTMSDDESTSDEEDAETSADRKDLISELTHKGVTLGQYLADLPDGERKRNKVASREVVQAEFDQLMKSQRNYLDNELNFDELEDKLSAIIFTQKPTFWRLNTLGTCEFFPDDRLCLSGSWIAHQRKLLENVNNLSIVDHDEMLSPAARLALLEAAGNKASMTWKGVHRVLKPIFEEEGYYTERLKLNKEAERKTLIGNPIERGLSQIFGESWEAHPAKDAIRSSIHLDLYKCDYEEIGTQRVAILRADTRNKNRNALIDTLMDKHNISRDEASQLSELKIKPGWEIFSVRAIEHLIVQLSEGWRMGELLHSPDCEEWRCDTFPDRLQPASEAVDFIPSPSDKEEQARLNRIKNPSVIRVLNEVRKVVNNLIRVHGRPDLIRVELSRDLRNTKKQREKIEAINRANKRRRDEARKDLEDRGLREPSRRDLDKWTLWKECDEMCPYTGKPISFDDLFGRNPSVEIEHIWPWSRSFDDRMVNKTLCFSSENRWKGNRIPYEYLHDNEDAWAQLVDRIHSMRGSRTNPRGMSSGKIARFLKPEIPEGFTERHLRDTSYAAREAIASLERLWPNEEIRKRVKVQAVSGSATSKMRYLWGLNNILNEDSVKTRDDHRHHAIDALTIGCIYPGTVSSLLRDHYVDDTAPVPKPMTRPWPSIREDAEHHVANLVVSHRALRKVSGALHKETVYGRTPVTIKRNGVTYTQFVTRKNIADLTPKQRRNIRDEHIRQLALERTSEDESEITLGAKKRVVKKVRVLVDRDANVMEKMTTGYVGLGNNHHMVVYKDQNGEVKHKVVPLLDAARRIRKNKPAVDKSMTNGYEFINSFSRNEIIQIEEGEKAGLWVITQLNNNGQFVLCRSNASGESATKQKWSPRVSTVIKQGGRKVSIDPIGNIRPAND